MQMHGYQAKMKKIMLVIIATILLSSMAMASTMTRTAPSTVEPNEQFTVTYTTSNAPDGKWFVAWEETITNLQEETNQHL